MTALPHNPFYAATHLQSMGTKEPNQKMAMVFTGMTVALVALMLVKEARELFKDKDHRGHLSENGRSR